VSSYHFCLLNKLETASYHAQEALRYAEITGSPFYHAVAHSLKGQVSFVEGDIENARYHNFKSRAIGKQMSSYLHQFRSTLFEAILEWNEGSQATALSLLSDSLTLAKQYNLIPGLWVCDEAMAEILAEAIRNNIEPDYARLIISKRNLMPVTLPYDIETWPWLIRIRTLGRFEILISGKPIKSPGRARPKVFLFLKALIALGGKQVREELICEAVWSDAEGDIAHQLYTTTLFRSRKMLGSHEMLIHIDGRLSLNERLCWLDVWAFKAGADKLSRLLKSTPIQTENLKLYYDQLHDYCADFREYDECFFEVTHMQHQMRLKWIRILYFLAEHWMKEDFCEYAKQCLETILNVNKLEEKAYYMLMSFHLAQGSLAEAASIYESCKKSLKEELDVKPSPKTEALYKKIRETGDHP